MSIEVLHSTRNCTQSLGTDHDGRYYEKGKVYICMPESLCCPAEFDTTQQINYTAVKDEK